MGLTAVVRLVSPSIKEALYFQVTMYHWEMPQALEEQGGWKNRKIVEYFEDYAEILYTHFGDKVIKYLMQFFFTIRYCWFLQDIMLLQVFEVFFFFFFFQTKLILEYSEEGKQSFFFL